MSAAKCLFILWWGLRCFAFVRKTLECRYQRLSGYLGENIRLAPCIHTNLSVLRLSIRTKVLTIYTDFFPTYSMLIYIFTNLTDLCCSVSSISLQKRRIHKQMVPSFQNILAPRFRQPFVSNQFCFSVQNSFSSFTIIVTSWPIRWIVLDWQMCIHIWHFMCLLVLCRWSTCMLVYLHGKIPN